MNSKLLLGIMIGFGLAIILVGCSAATFPYRWYGMDDAIRFDSGKLLGDRPEHDLSFEACRPTAQKAHPCVVVFADEFFKLKTEHLDLQNRLNRCEAGQ